MARLEDILIRKWPGKEWTFPVSGDYSTLIWHQEGETPPSEAEILAFSDEVDLLMRRERMVVTPLQFRLALDAEGLFDECEALAAAASRVVQLSWQYAVTIERLNPFIDEFAASLNPPKSPEEVDGIFDLAATF